MTEAEPRDTWTTRINLRMSARDLIQQRAKNERMSVATMIGIAVEAYVDPITRSSTA